MPAPTGPTPRLSDAPLAAIDQALRQGARAHGFDTTTGRLSVWPPWSLRLTGVAYHRGHVWKLLRQRLVTDCSSLLAAPSSVTSRPLPAGC